MSENQQIDSYADSDLTERFIDGLLTKAETDKFLANTNDRQEAFRQRDVQNLINESLARSFPLDTLNEGELTRNALEILLSKSLQKSQKNSLPPKVVAVRKNSWVKMGLAASLLLCVGLGTWMLGQSGQAEPYFRPRALAVLYQETKDHGFRPYYHCKDDKRFAETFQQRLGQPLALSDMPQGTRMLGISYPGGISRNTTAILGVVDGNSVMVFVDETKNRGQVIKSIDEGSNLNVFSVEKNGLIFCEVTPLDSAKLIRHFEFLQTR